MKMIRNAFFAVAALAAVLGFSAPPSFAASAQLCGPAGDNTGSRRVVNPNTNVAYTMDGRGCAVVDSADVGWFQSQGYVSIAPFRSVTAKGQTAAFTMILPPGTFIRDIIAQETSGATVTGGLKIGTTAGGTDVVSVLALTSLNLVTTQEVSMAKRVFSSTAPQTLFVGAVSSFNSSAVNLTVIFGYF